MEKRRERRGVRRGCAGQWDQLLRIGPRYIHGQPLPSAGSGTGDRAGDTGGPGCVSRRCSQEYGVRGPTLQNVSPEPSGMVLRGAGAG